MVKESAHIKPCRLLQEQPEPSKAIKQPAVVIAANPALAKARNPGKASGKAQRKRKSRDSRAVELDAGEHLFGIWRALSAMRFCVDDMSSSQRLHNRVDSLQKTVTQLLTCLTSMTQTLHMDCHGRQLLCASTGCKRTVSQNIETLR